MSLLLSDDLNEVLTAFYEHVKEHGMLKTKYKESEKIITLLKSEVLEARRAEKRASSNLKRVQENVLQLQEIVSNLANVRVENEKLKKEISTLGNLLEEEKKNLLVCELKWNNDKEAITNRNKEELENMKKIRNMEAISLNREISRLQEENNQRIEDLKKDLKKKENEYKLSLSQAVDKYEEKLLSMNRDLIAANNEVKNLRLLNDNGMTPYNIDLGQPKSERNIPQPMAFARYRQLPIVSTASQLYTRESKDPSTRQVEEITPDPQQPQGKSDSRKSNLKVKKRKLYSRDDDSLLY